MPLPSLHEDSECVSPALPQKRSQDSHINNMTEEGCKTSLQNNVGEVQAPSPKKHKVQTAPHPSKSSTFHSKNMSLGVLEGDGGSEVRLESLRGNYWRTMGHTGVGGTNLLYIEEALYLVEKHQLCIVDKSDGVSDNESDRDAGVEGSGENVRFYTIRQFYERVAKGISLECYLTFVKLKSLDYVVRRSGTDIRSFGEEADVLSSFRQFLVAHRHCHPRGKRCDEPSLLQYMSSFFVYLAGDNYTKRNAAAGVNRPVAHVIVTSCPKLYSSTLMLTLLKQAKSVPCIFAVVMSHSGYVVLEELTCAQYSLSWDFGTMQHAGTGGNAGTSDKSGTGDNAGTCSNAVTCDNAGTGDLKQSPLQAPHQDDNEESDDRDAVNCSQTGEGNVSPYSRATNEGIEEEDCRIRDDASGGTKFQGDWVVIE